MEAILVINFILKTISKIVIIKYEYLQLFELYYFFIINFKNPKK